MTVLVNTDALIGLVDAPDGLYQQSTYIAQELIKLQATIFILPTTLAEFALVASGKIGMQAAKPLVDVLLVPILASTSTRYWSREPQHAMLSKPPRSPRCLIVL